MREKTVKWGHAGRLTAAATLVLALGACGGGGSGSASSGGSVSSFVLSGVAATGAALNGASITAICAAGTTTPATSGSDGSYTLNVTNGSLPCVLEATSGSTSYHSVVASGTTANITPLTELLVAQLTGQDPATFYSGASASGLSSTVTTSGVSSAKTAVIALLTDAGVSTTNLTDILNGSLTAGSSSGYDGVLDALQTALNDSGSQLSDLTSTVVSSASGSGTTTETSGTDATALAPELLLKAQESTCSALRAADYWAVFSGFTGTTAGVPNAVKKITISITSGAATATIGSKTMTLTAVDATNDACRFTTTSTDTIGSGAISLGDADITVSPAGVMVGVLNGASSSTDTTLKHPTFIAIPAQTHTVADIAGDWNFIGSDTTDPTNASPNWIYLYATTNISTAGKRTVTAGCSFETVSSTACTELTTTDLTEANATSVVYTVNDDGGFTETAGSPSDEDYSVERLFVYKAGNGQYIGIGANTYSGNEGTDLLAGQGDGSVSYFTKKRTLSLPAVNSTSTGWSVAYNWVSGRTADGAITSANGNTFDGWTDTITSVNTSAGSFLKAAGNADNSVTHPETLQINNPYTGFRFRDYVASVTASDSSTATVHKNIQIKTGAGVNVGLQPAEVDGSNTVTRRAKVSFSVSKPN